MLLPKLKEKTEILLKSDITLQTNDLTLNYSQRNLSIFAEITLWEENPLKKIIQLLEIT